eukprot:Nk52_evm3s349 gene=Nk52_evmTU3s349
MRRHFTWRSALLMVLLLGVTLISVGDVGVEGMIVSSVNQSSFSLRELMTVNSSISFEAECDAKSPPVNYGWFILQSTQLPLDFILKDDETKFCCDESQFKVSNYTCLNGIVVPKDKDVLGKQVGRFNSDECQIVHKQVYDKIPLDGYWTAAVFGCAKEVYLSTVTASFQNPTGYLPVDAYPFEVVHLALTILYSILALYWLIVCAIHHTEILPVQFWISGVIGLGILEMALFYEFYSHANDEGTSSSFIQGFAVFFMCLQIALGSMLVLVISMGYGVVKPTLGETMNIVYLFGALYFLVLAVYWETLHLQHTGIASGFLKTIEIISVFPLSFLDVSLFCWIFVSLSNLMKTLNLKKQMVKLALYRKFSYLLAFCFAASLLCTLFDFYLKVKIRKDGSNEWVKYKWIDILLWKGLFFIMVVCTAVLWRPTKNNRQYAYSAVAERTFDDDWDDHPNQPNFTGMKLRTLRRVEEDDEDDLRWVEENIPTAADDEGISFMEAFNLEDLETEGDEAELQARRIEVINKVE